MGTRLGTAAAGLAAALALCAAASAQQAKTATIGYQLVMNPWKAAIADGAFEAATGYEIAWKRFDSGAKVLVAMASGDVDIALAGSSPIAAGASRELPVKLFWIAESINDAEALVVRDGSGIAAPQDLRGKRIGVPFVSTAHFHLLFALEQFRIAPGKVRLLNMQPNAIAAAWLRGNIDAAYVWNPALARIKASGKVLIASGLLSSWGRTTFDGLVVRDDFAAAHPDFMCGFVRAIAQADAAWRDDPAAFGPGSDNARKIAGLAGGDPAEVASIMSLHEFPTLEEQAGPTWLGGGAAATLEATSRFLKEKKKIAKLLPDYRAVVTDAFVKAAIGGC